MASTLDFDRPLRSLVDSSFIFGDSTPASAAPTAVPVPAVAKQTPASPAKKPVVASKTIASKVTPGKPVAKPGAKPVAGSKAATPQTSSTAAAPIAASKSAADPYAVKQLLHVVKLCGDTDEVGHNEYQEHLTLAGSDVRLAQPTRGCIDPFGNFIFADQQNSVIRRVTPGGHSDVIGGRAQHTGKVDGDASRARFYWPSSVDVLPLAADVFVPLPNAIKFSTFSFSEFASQHLDDEVTRAQRNAVAPEKLRAGFDLVVADEYNHCIRAIAPDGTVRTLAGDGKAGCADGRAREAQFIDPKDVAVYQPTRTVYVTDCTNQAIRAVSAHGVVSTLYQFQSDDIPHRPSGICLDLLNRLIVTDTAAHCIYCITRGEDNKPAECKLLAGTEWVAGHRDSKSALFNFPTAVCLDAHGNLLVADTGNHAIRLVTPSGEVRTLCGHSKGFDEETESAVNTAAGALDEPVGVAYDSRGGGRVFVTSKQAVFVLCADDKLTRWKRRAALIIARSILGGIKDHPLSEVGRSQSFARRTMHALCLVDQSASKQADPADPSTAPAVGIVNPAMRSIPPHVPPVDRFAELMLRVKSSMATPKTAAAAAKLMNIDKTSDTWRFLSPNEQARLEAQAAQAASDQGEYDLNVEEIVREELQEQDSRPIIQHAPEICMLVEDKLFQRIVSFL